MATPKKLHELLNQLVPSSIIQYNNNNNHHSSNNILSKLTPLLIQVKNNVPSQSEYEQICNLLDQALDNGEKIKQLDENDYTGMGRFSVAWENNVSSQLWEKDNFNMVDDENLIWLPEHLTPSRLERALRTNNYIGIPDHIHIVKIDKRRIGVGTGFLSNMNKCKVQYNVSKEEAAKYKLPEYMIAKLTPADADLQTRIRCRASRYLLTEFSMYKHFMSKRIVNHERKGSFIPVQRKDGGKSSASSKSSSEDGYNVATLLYGTYNPILDRSTIILEDLSERNGRMRDQLEGHDYEESKKILKYAAAFHADFWGIKPLEINEDLNFVREVVGASVYLKFNGEKYVNGIEGMYTLAGELGFARNSIPARSLRLFGENFVEFLSAWLPVDELNDETGISGTNTAVTLCHGDLRSDNTFFCDNDINVVPIDYQAVRKFVPELDIAYFLSQSLDPAVRRETQTDLLLQYYHDMISYRGGVENFYPLEIMLARLQTTIIYANRTSLLLEGIGGRVRDPEVSERGGDLFEAMNSRGMIAMEEWGSLNAAKAQIERGNRQPTVEEARKLIKGTSLESVLWEEKRRNQSSLKTTSNTVKYDSTTMLISDIDGTMIGDDAAIHRFNHVWKNEIKSTKKILVYNTSRSLDSFKRLRLTRKSPLLMPDLFIGNNGCTMCTFKNGDVEQFELIDSYTNYLIKENGGFDKEQVRNVTNNVVKRVMGDIPGEPVMPDPKTGSSRDVLMKREKFILYQREDKPVNPLRVCITMRTKDTHRDTKIMEEALLKEFDKLTLENNFPPVYINVSWVQLAPRREGGDYSLRASGSDSQDMALLDIVPQSAGKGVAAIYAREVIFNGLVKESNVMVAGDGWNDAPMFFNSGNERGCFVGNAEKELVDEHIMIPRKRHYHANGYYGADGLIDGLRHFGFAKSKNESDVKILTMEEQQVDNSKL